MSKEIGKVYKTEDHVYIQIFEDSNTVFITDMNVVPQFTGTFEIDRQTLKEICGIVKLADKEYNRE